MLIGELAKSLGVTPKTLRLYEQRGLIPAPARAGNGYRAYGEDAIRRARLVVGLRGIGLSLETIAGLVGRKGADRNKLRRDLAGLLSEQIQELSLEIAVRQGRLDDLDARYLALMDTPREAPGDCVCRALNLRCRCVAKRIEAGSVPVDPMSPIGNTGRPLARGRA